MRDRPKPPEATQGGQPANKQDRDFSDPWFYQPDVKSGGQESVGATQGTGRGARQESAEGARPESGEAQGSSQVTFEIPEKARGKVEPMEELIEQARTRREPHPNPSDLVDPDALQD